MTVWLKAIYSAQKDIICTTKINKNVTGSGWILCLTVIFVYHWWNAISRRRPRPKHSDRSSQRWWILAFGEGCCRESRLKKIFSRFCPQPSRDRPHRSFALFYWVAPSGGRDALPAQVIAWSTESVCLAKGFGTVSSLVDSYTASHPLCYPRLSEEPFPPSQGGEGFQGWASSLAFSFCIVWVSMTRVKSSFQNNQVCFRTSRRNTVGRLKSH